MSLNIRLRIRRFNLTARVSHLLTSAGENKYLLSELLKGKQQWQLGTKCIHKHFQCSSNASRVDVEISSGIQNVFTLQKKSIMDEE